jgi:hypothetical protein
MLPLDELKQLEAQVNSATEVEALRPMYDRLGEIARDYTADFEVQLAVAEARQHIIEKGLAVRRAHSFGSSSEEPAGPRPPKRPQVVDLPPLPKPPPWPERASPKPPEPETRGPRLGLGIALGIAATLIFFVVVVQIARNRNMPTPAPAPPATTAAAPGTVPVDIITAPPGATVQINGETKCRSNCRVNLAPGNYQCQPETGSAISGGPAVHRPGQRQRPTGRKAGGRTSGRATRARPRTKRQTLPAGRR